MRVIGRRTKKLRVAFHFQFSNPAGWKCAECRKSRLEKKRRCGWLPEALEGPARVVWTRAGVATTICPRSYITGESAAWLADFEVWRRFGHADAAELPARQVHAMMCLENELSQEMKRANE